MGKKITSVVLVLCMMLSCLTVGSFVAEARTTKTAEVSAMSTSESTGADYGLVDNVQQGQILQCWNWSYNGIKSNMKKIAEQGFSAIQTSPIQTIKETTQNRSFSGSWWVYYQPSNFKIDTSSQNALGTKSDFKAMCDEAHKYGVKVIVDAVLNHMANNGDNTLSPTIPDDIRNDSSCWYNITENTTNWSNRWDITHKCMSGLPDLNTGNTKIQNYEINFLKECIDCGADGFRFDGAKHIEVPSDNNNASSNFWSNVLSAITNYSKSKRGVTPYYYGEILDNTGGGQGIVNQYTNFMSVTCNGVSNDIRNKVDSGNANGAKRSDYNYDDNSHPAASKAVLWNESHDTYADNKSRGQSDSTLNKTWALVGTRAEACGMYLARPANYSQQIGTASVTAWANDEVRAVNQFKNAMVGQTEYLSAEGSIAYNERGTQGVVLVNCSGGSQSVNVTAHKMKNDTYKDAITGNEFKVEGGKIKGQIGSTGIAVVYKAQPAGPSASVKPDSSSYKTDTLTLTLNYKNATSGQYSIDGGAYTNYTDGQTITIGSGLAYGTKTTVSVKATDGSTTSEVKTYTYTKVDPSATQMVYFDNSSYNWSKVNAYIYKAVDEDTLIKNAVWPGQEMKYNSSTKLYELEVPDNLSDGLVIFTESYSATTNRYPADGEDGLALEGKSKLFKANRVWVDYDEPVPTQPTTSVQPTTAPHGRILIGDTNLDGEITVDDATEIQRHLVDMIILSDEAIIAADTDESNNIDISDVTRIMFYLVGSTDRSGKCGEYVGGEEPTTVQPTTAQPTTAQPTTTGSDKYTMTFTNNYNWNNVYCYYWSNSNTTMTSWPGKAMTYSSTNDLGQKIYTIEIPSSAEFVIFNNGSGTQTVDVPVTGSAKYYISGGSGSSCQVKTWE